MERLRNRDIKLDPILFPKIDPGNTEADHGTGNPQTDEGRDGNPKPHDGLRGLRKRRRLRRRREQVRREVEVTLRLARPRGVPHATGRGPGRAAQAVGEDVCGGQDGVFPDKVERDVEPEPDESVGRDPRAAGGEERARLEGGRGGLGRGGERAQLGGVEDGRERRGDGDGGEDGVVGARGNGREVAGDGNRGGAGGTLGHALGGG